MSRKSAWRPLDTLVLLGCAGVLSATIVPSWVYINDDAFISFRYAANLLSGEGLTFNPGERVEGYTNFLWVMMSAGLLALGGPENLLWLSKSVGALLALATVALTYLTGRKVFQFRTCAAGAALLLAAWPGFAVNAVSGLETSLFTFLITLALYLRIEPGPRADWAFAAVMALASLTRPEGFFLFALLLPFHVVADRSREGFFVRVLRMGALYGFLVGPYLLWKFIYYGSFLPNTYYAKPGTLIGGIAYVWSFVVEGGFFSLGAVGLLSVVLGFICLRRARLWLIGFFLAQLSAILLSGGDWMLGWRFFVPALPILCVAMGAGVDRAVSWTFLRQPVLAYLLAAAWFVALAYSFSLPREALLADGRARGEGQRTAHEFIGKWLADQARPGESVALMDIGMVGFHTPLRVIDITGLTDRFIAHSPGPILNKQYDPRYVLHQRPDYVVLVGRRPFDTGEAPRSLAGPEWERVRRGLWAQDRRIASLPRFARDYELAFSRSASFEGYLHVFQRRREVPR